MLEFLLSVCSLTYVLLVLHKPKPNVDAIEKALPGWQCGYCNFPGCRPYAEYVAQGGNIMQCRPGGMQQSTQLAKLTATELGTLLDTKLQPQIAKIVEDECIGCTKCIQVCPTDCIIGANGCVHTVITDACTGCDLCIAACPVDCIDLLEITDHSQEQTEQFHALFEERELRRVSKQTNSVSGKLTL